MEHDSVVIKSKKKRHKTQPSDDNTGNTDATENEEGSKIKRGRPRKGTDDFKTPEKTDFTVSLTTTTITTKTTNTGTGSTCGSTSGSTIGSTSGTSSGSSLSDRSTVGTSSSVIGPATATSNEVPKKSKSKKDTADISNNTAHTTSTSQTSSSGVANTTSSTSKKSSNTSSSSGSSSSSSSRSSTSTSGSSKTSNNTSSIKVANSSSASITTSSGTSSTTSGTTSSTTSSSSTSSSSSRKKNKITDGSSSTADSVSCTTSNKTSGTSDTSGTDNSPPSSLTKTRPLPAMPSPIAFLPQVVPLSPSQATFLPPITKYSHPPAQHPYSPTPRSGSPTTASLPLPLYMPINIHEIVRNPHMNMYFRFNCGIAQQLHIIRNTATPPPLTNEPDSSPRFQGWQGDDIFSGPNQTAACTYLHALLGGAGLTPLMPYAHVASKFGGEKGKTGVEVPTYVYNKSLLLYLHLQAFGLVYTHADVVVTRAETKPKQKNTPHSHAFIGTTGMLDNAVAVLELAKDVKACKHPVSSGLFLKDDDSATRDSALDVVHVMDEDNVFNYLFVKVVMLNAYHLPPSTSENTVRFIPIYLTDLGTSDFVIKAHIVLNRGGYPTVAYEELSYDTFVRQLTQTSRPKNTPSANIQIYSALRSLRGEERSPPSLKLRTHSIRRDEDFDADTASDSRSPLTSSCTALGGDRKEEKSSAKKTRAVRITVPKAPKEGLLTSPKASPNAGPASSPANNPVDASNRTVRSTAETENKAAKAAVEESKGEDSGSSDSSSDEDTSPSTTSCAVSRAGRLATTEGDTLESEEDSEEEHSEEEAAQKPAAATSTSSKLVVIAKRASEGGAKKESAEDSDSEESSSEEEDEVTPSTTTSALSTRQIEPKVQSEDSEDDEESEEESSDEAKKDYKTPLSQRTGNRAPRVLL